MIYNKPKKSFFSFNLYLYIIFSVVFLYAFVDAQTSSSTGFRGSERTQVYIFLLLAIFLMSIYNVRYALKQIRLLTLTNSLLLITIWVTFVNIIQEANIWVFATHIVLSVWWIMAYHFFYNYLYNNPNSLNKIIFLFSLMCLFYVSTAMFAADNISMLYDRIAVVNLAYNVIVFLPLIGLMANGIFKKIFFAIVLGVVIVSMKRGAVIVYPLMIIAMMLTEAKINKEKIKAFAKIILVFILFLVGLVIADNFTGGYLSQRFSLEELSTGSNRDILYSTAIDSIIQRSAFDFFIGTGSGSSGIELGLNVHNEWLEFLFSFGLIGLICYFIFIVTMIKCYFNLLKHRSRYAAAYSMAVVYVIVIGMVGMIYFVHSSFYIMSFCGIVDYLAKEENKCLSRS